MRCEPVKQSKIAKKRLDLLLVERGMVESRAKAQGLILAGGVRVNGQREDKAGAAIALDAAIEITGETPRYASRAGLKLEGALEEFGVDPSGRVCLDAGSSTGGFTDCLLQNGAARVYAVERHNEPTRMEAATRSACNTDRSERSLPRSGSAGGAAFPRYRGFIVYLGCQGAGAAGFGGWCWRGVSDSGEAAV